MSVILICAFLSVFLEMASTFSMKGARAKGMPLNLSHVLLLFLNVYFFLICFFSISNCALISFSLYS